MNPNEVRKLEEQTGISAEEALALTIVAKAQKHWIDTRDPDNTDAPSACDLIMALVGRLDSHMSSTYREEAKLIERLATHAESLQQIAIQRTPAYRALQDQCMRYRDIADKAHDQKRDLRHAFMGLAIEHGLTLAHKHGMGELDQDTHEALEHFGFGGTED